MVDTRAAFFNGRTYQAPVYDRARLRAGNRFAGPAIVMEYSATTVVPPGWAVRGDEYENMILTRQGIVKSGKVKG